MNIEDASERDLPEIIVIYNDAIANSTAVFSDQPVTVERQRAWLNARLSAGHPVIVARLDGAVVGFASYGEFRPWPGYRRTVEHSVYVLRSRRRQGIGRRLVGELLDRATRAGMHAVVAGVDAENQASLRMHEQLGFVQVGRMPEVARKFDRWLDLVLLQITL
ncbi:MAG: acetyltransferase [Solirubrobacterales bacterium]|jgi:phosphinothricin acetyltransferase|nr:acetyltransferase [Solirubrobacterales bacterium]